jgi:DNA end-binding protein Ku
MVPTGRPELIEPFAVIREAMEGAGRVALGRVVMTGRERIVAIEVRGAGFLLSTLHAQDEVRSDAELFDEIPQATPDPQMIDIARAIIDKQEGPFDPSLFEDRYAEAMRKLVAEKSEGAVIERQDAPPESNVIDLMDALRRSLRGGAESETETETETKKPPKKKSTARAKAEPEPAPAPAKRRAGSRRS